MVLYKVVFMKECSLQHNGMNEQGQAKRVLCDWRRGGGNGLRHHQISRYPISFYENGMWFTFLVPPGPFIYVNHLIVQTPSIAPSRSRVDVISFWGSWHRSFTSSSLDRGWVPRLAVWVLPYCTTVQWLSGARRKENYLVGIYCAVCPTLQPDFYLSMVVADWICV